MEDETNYENSPPPGSLIPQMTGNENESNYNNEEDNYDNNEENYNNNEKENNNTNEENNYKSTSNINTSPIQSSSYSNILQSDNTPLTTFK